MKLISDGGEKANYFIIIVNLLSSFIIGYHHPFCGFDSRRGHKQKMPPLVDFFVCFWYGGEPTWVRTEGRSQAGTSSRSCRRHAEYPRRGHKIKRALNERSFDFTSSINFNCIPQAMAMMNNKTWILSVPWEINFVNCLNLCVYGDLHKNSCPCLIANLKTMSLWDGFLTFLESVRGRKRLIRFWVYYPSVLTLEK